MTPPDLKAIYRFLKTISRKEMAITFFEIDTPPGLKSTPPNLKSTPPILKTTP